MQNIKQKQKKINKTVIQQNPRRQPDRIEQNRIEQNRIISQIHVVVFCIVTYMYISNSEPY